MPSERVSHLLERLPDVPERARSMTRDQLERVAAAVSVRIETEEDWAAVRRFAAPVAALFAPRLPPISTGPRSTLTIQQLLDVDRRDASARCGSPIAQADVAQILAFIAALAAIVVYLLIRAQRKRREHERLRSKRCESGHR